MLTFGTATCWWRSRLSTHIALARVCALFVLDFRMCCDLLNGFSFICVNAWLCCSVSRAHSHTEIWFNRKKNTTTTVFETFQPSILCFYSSHSSSLHFFLFDSIFLSFSARRLNCEAKIRSNQMKSNIFSLSNLIGTGWVKPLHLISSTTGFYRYFFSSHPLLIAALLFTDFSDVFLAIQCCLDAACKQNYFISQNSLTKWVEID